MEGEAKTAVLASICMAIWLGWRPNRRRDDQLVLDPNTHQLTLERPPSKTAKPLADRSCLPTSRGRRASTGDPPHRRKTRTHHIMHSPIPPRKKPRARNPFFCQIHRPCHHHHGTRDTKNKTRPRRERTQQRRRNKSIRPTSSRPRTQD